MARVRASTIIDAPPREVWRAIEDIATHVEWMADAVEIRFLGEQRSGTGTRFECDTRLGPLRTTDVMEITDWVPGTRMGVRHVGVVTGEGAFTLKRARRGRTRFRWDERLRFPWWMGGPIGGVVGGRVLAAVWRRNLRRLAARVAGGR